MVLQESTLKATQLHVTPLLLSAQRHPPRRRSHRAVASVARRVARGTFLCRFDADDVMHPERVERQVEALRAQRLGTCWRRCDVVF